jgi:ATP-dependent Lon protease
MKLVLELLNRKREILKLSNKIDSAVKGEMSKTQREYYLRQQLKAIKEELGEMGEEEEELDELQERIKKAGLPPEVEKVANKELNRLKTIPAASSEYTVARTYLDWIADLPWSKMSEDNLDIENARKVLDTDHYGIQKVKKRILEYLAVRNVARRVDRQGRRPQVRPPVAGRRARRSGDPRSPAHVRRRPPRPLHPVDEEGRHQEPGDDARRDRQARRRLQG